MRLYSSYWELYSLKKQKTENSNKSIDSPKRRRFSKEINILNQYQSIFLKSIGVLDKIVYEERTDLNYTEYVETLLGKLSSLREQQYMALLGAFRFISNIESELGSSDAYFYDLVGKFIHNNFGENLKDQDALSIYSSIMAWAKQVKQTKQVLERQNKGIGTNAALQAVKYVTGSGFQSFLSKISDTGKEIKGDINIYKKMYEQVFAEFLNYAKALHEGVSSKLEANKSVIETIMRDQEKGYDEAIEITIYRNTAAEDDYVDELSELEKDILIYIKKQSNEENFRHYLDKLLKKHYEENETSSYLLHKFIDLAFTPIYDDEEEEKEEEEDINIKIKEMVDAANIFEAFARSMEAIEQTIIIKKYNGSNEAIYESKEKINQLNKKINEFNEICENIIDNFVRAFEDKAVPLWDLLTLLKEKTSLVESSEIDLKRVIQIYILKLLDENLFSMQYQKSRVGKARNEEIMTKMKRNSDILMKLVERVTSSDFFKEETPEIERKKILEVLEQLKKYDESSPDEKSPAKTSLADLLTKINTSICTPFYNYISKIVEKQKSRGLYAPNLATLLELKLYSESESESESEIEDETFEYAKDILEINYPMIKYIIVKDIIYKIGYISGKQFRDFVILVNKLVTNNAETYTKISYKNSFLRIYEMLLEISNQYAITIKSILKWIAEKIVVKGEISQYESSDNKLVIKSYQGEGAINKILAISKLWISSVTEFYVDLLDYFYIVFANTEQLKNFIRKFNGWCVRNSSANPYNTFTPKTWDTYPHVISVYVNPDNQQSSRAFDIIDPCFIFYMSMRLHDYIIRETANFYQDESLYSLIYNKKMINPKGRKPENQDPTTTYLGILGYTSEELGEIAFKYGDSLIYHNIIYGQVPNGLKAEIQRYSKERGTEDFSSFYLHLKSLKI